MSSHTKPGRTPLPPPPTTNRPPTPPETLDRIWARTLADLDPRLSPLNRRLIRTARLVALNSVAALVESPDLNTVRFIGTYHRALVQSALTRAAQRPVRLTARRSPALRP